MEDLQPQIIASTYLRGDPSPAERRSWASRVGTLFSDIMDSIPSSDMTVEERLAYSKQFVEQGENTLQWLYDQSKQSPAAEGTLFLLTAAECFVGEFLKEGQSFFAWVSGIGQGIAIALVVSRLDSRYLRIVRFQDRELIQHSVVVGLCLAYSTLQVAWPFFLEPQSLVPERVLTFIAMGLKCLLFLFGLWLIEMNLFVFYFRRSRELEERVDDARWRWLKKYDNQTFDA